MLQHSIHDRMVHNPSRVLETGSVDVLVLPVSLNLYLLILILYFIYWHHHLRYFIFNL